MAVAASKLFKDFLQVVEEQRRLQGEYIPRTIEIRLDPLFQLHSTQISVERAQRGGSFKPAEPIVMKPKEQCVFCKEGGLYTKTSEGKRFHRATEPNPGYELISIPNLFPFMPHHWVTVISDSIDELDLLNLHRGDMLRYLDSGYDFAKEFVDLEGMTGMVDFINWGPRAGASVDHPHAQRGAISDYMKTLADNEIDKCEQFRRQTREDPFGVFMAQVRRTKGSSTPLYCFENDNVMVVCPYGPRFSDQVDIIYKKNVNNILYLTPKERADIADAMIMVLHALGSLDTLPKAQKRRKVTDLNVVLHQARFGDKRDYYRVHWHITPRMDTIGSLESGYHSYVVDVFPETTASNVRTLTQR